MGSKKKMMRNEIRQELYRNAMIKDNCLIKGIGLNLIHCCLIVYPHRSMMITESYSHGRIHTQSCSIGKIYTSNLLSP